jgi:hypothetical protein
VSASRLRDPPVFRALIIPLSSSPGDRPLFAVLFAKACELFITELTIRSYCYSNTEGGAGSSKRRTLTREDVCTAVQKTDIFDFLVGVLTPGSKPQYQIDLENGVLPSGDGGAGAGAGAGAGEGSGGGGGGGGSRSGGRRR